MGSAVVDCVSLVTTGSGPLEATGGGPSSSGGGTGGGGLEGPFITIAVTAEDATNKSLVEGVEICALDLPIDCVTTDGEGQATIAVPSHHAIYATLLKDGYLNSLVGAFTGVEDMELTAPMVNATIAPILAGAVGVSFDPEKGQIALAAVQPPEPGTTKYPTLAQVTFALSPPPADGPFYGDENYLPDPLLTETSSAGSAYMFNVEPGTAELTATHTTETCRDFLAHPSASKPDAYDVRVMADYVTFVSVICGEPAQGGTGGAGGSGGAGGAGGSGGAAGSGG